MSNPTTRDRTTIAVNIATADDLHDRKNRGESYDDVINRLMEQNSALQERVSELEAEVDD